MFKDLAQLHLIVFIWGFTSILGNVVSIPAVELVFFRCLIAVLGLLVVARLYKTALVPDRKGITYMSLNGLLVGVHWVTFFAASQIGNASIALIGVPTVSLWTSIMEPWISGKKFQWFELILGLFVIAGIVIIVQYEGGHSFALVLALISAFFGALFSVINVNFVRKYDATVISIYELAGAGVFALAVLPAYLIWIYPDSNYSLYPNAKDYFYIPVLAIVCTVYPYVKSVSLLKRISAFTVNLTVNLEPIYGILLAALLLGEHEEMTPQFYLGAVIILISVLIYPLTKKYFEKK